MILIETPLKHRTIALYFSSGAVVRFLNSVTIRSPVHFIYILTIVLAAWLSLFAPAAAAPRAQFETIPAGPPQLYLPLMANHAGIKSQQPPRVYDLIPVEGGSIGRPAEASADVNLAHRGYVSTDAFAGLIDINGPTDSNAPQLAGIFNHQRDPVWTHVYQVRDWDWGLRQRRLPRRTDHTACGDDGRIGVHSGRGDLYPYARP